MGASLTAILRNLYERFWPLWDRRELGNRARSRGRLSDEALPSITAEMRLLGSRFDGSSQSYA